MKLCGVSFKENGKVYNFNPGRLEVDKGDHVIVETEKGEQYGKVTFVGDQEVSHNLKYVVRIATDSDYEKYLKNLSDAKKALVEVRKMAEELGLEMQLIDCSYTFDRKQLLFNFIADERVDFRELVRLLAGKYRTRIELHQIGVRDKAKEIGGIGACGMSLCCSSFLSHIDAITINMAKNQGIALNPTKINGACGRLLCCLSYEDEQYSECRKDLPNIGEEVKVDGVKGRVIALDILNRSYKVNADGEIKEFKVKSPCCKGKHKKNCCR